MNINIMTLKEILKHRDDIKIEWIVKAIFTKTIANRRRSFQINTYL